MLRINRCLAMLVLFLGIVSVVIGSVFIIQAVEKNNLITETMRQEKVTLGLSQEQIANGEVIDTAKEAQAASDKIAADRREIAPSYTALLGGNNFDPTNPEELAWAQALNMENSLNIAVLSFGVITVITGAGIFMIITGIALGATGAVLLRSARTT